MKLSRELLLASAVLSTAPFAVRAQTAEVTALETVIVTAERREVSTQQTPLTITALTGEMLAEKGIADARTMMDSVPGFDMTFGNPVNQIGLYGLASGGGTMWADGVMTFNYGGVPLSRQTAAASSMYDLDRVEVLKGPQGTLYGRNATVGALNLLPTRPGDELGGKVSITMGNYSALNTSGAINLPFSDRVKSRFAAQTSRHDGYFTNGYDDANNMGARAAVQFEITDQTSLLVWTDVFRNRSKGSMATWRYYLSSTQEWIDPSNPWFGIGPAGSCTNQLLCPSFASTTVGGVNVQTPVAGFADLGPNGLGLTSVHGSDGKNNADQNIYAAELNSKLGIGDLTVIAARVDTAIDFKSYSNGLLFTNVTDAYQNSLEVRLTSNGEGKLQWVVGAFYFQEHQNAFQNNLQSTGWAVLYTPNLEDENYAAFADSTFDVTERVRLLAGVRYTNEKKSQDGFVTSNGLTTATMATFAAAGATCYEASIANKVYFMGTYYPANFCAVPNSGNYDDSNISWKAGIEFDVADDSMLYATARTGFRAGGFTGGTQNTYKPEKLTAYEIGSKNRFFDQRLQANLSAFYWRYEDQQISALRQYFLNGISLGQTSYPFSVDGWLRGAELDLLGAVGDHGTAHINTLFVQGEYDETPPLLSSVGVTAPLKDQPRFGLPEWQVSAGYSHELSLGGAGTLTPGASAHYESSAILRLADLPLLVPGERRDDYIKYDADLTWRPATGNWSVQAYIRNITNEAVVGVGSSGQSTPGVWFKPTTGTQLRSASLEPPRTYGIRISADF